MTLLLTTDEARLYGDALKLVFATYPGEYALYIKLPTTTIQAQATLLWNETVEAAIESIIGTGKIFVTEE